MNNAGLQAAEKLCRHARTSRGHLSETSLVCLVDLVCFVYLAHQVYPVSLFQPNKQDKPNKPIKRDRPDRPNRPNEQDWLADFFSILLGEAEQTITSALGGPGGRDLFYTLG